MIRLLFREELFELAIKVSNVVKGWSSLDKIKLFSFFEHCHFFSHAQPMLCCKFQQTHWRFPTRHDFVQPSQLFVSFPVKTPCCQLRRQVGPFIAMFTLHHHVAIKSHKRIEKRVGLFDNQRSNRGGLLKFGLSKHAQEERRRSIRGGSVFGKRARLREKRLGKQTQEKRKIL